MTTKWTQMTHGAALPPGPGHWTLDLYYDTVVVCCGRLSFCHPVPHPSVKFVSGFVVVPIRPQRSDDGLLIQSHPKACCSPQIHNRGGKTFASLQTLTGWMACPDFSSQAALILFIFVKSVHKLFLVQQFSPVPSFSKAEIPNWNWTF